MIRRPPRATRTTHSVPTRRSSDLGLLIIGLGAMFVRLPTGFLPEEDQGTIIALVQLPAGATAHRTTAVNDQMSEYLRGPEKHNVTSVLSVNEIGRASCRERVCQYV